MEFIEGRIFKDNQMPEVSKEDRKELYKAFIKTLAKLHQIDYKEIGLERYSKLNKQQAMVEQIVILKDK
jgi:aminoglycoside phosphotransferase (APT) family kinase protein